MCFIVSTHQKYLNYFMSNNVYVQVCVCITYTNSTNSARAAGTVSMIRLKYLDVHVFYH